MGKSRLDDRQKWYNPPTIKDNLTRNSCDTFSDYLAKEKEFLEKIYEEVKVEEGEGFNRYIRKNICSPYKDGNDLNSSFHLFPPDDNKKGGILLIHGLTDSPYHLKAIAEIFAENGYYVICLRLPGHGTTPGALLDVKWEDWYDAVKFVADMVRKEISKYKDKDPQFFVGGFSTGGALTLRYVLDTFTSGAPDKLFLFSPAIGVSWFAEFADWHKLISWIPYFRKFKWKDIKPEYDPCKYNSFPKNAGDQIYELTKENKKLVKKLVSNSDNLQNKPLIYAFQSIVDATVSTEDLVDLMDKIGTEESELVLFDINRNFKDFINSEPADNLLDEIKKRSDFKPRLIVVSNEGESDSELKWPEDVFALSHVCMPISPKDEYYGQDSILGTLNAKGEKDILVIDPSDLIRVRYNPFFSYIKTRIEKVISDDS
ncbi:MAG: alpha/beta fold hydrolase [Candidatus Aminicenantes bacterium]|nr:alpha/beta fold hydrolase [Candidatus Aminicenantes bacterium]NIM80877.1 alpha/beta fold hydrolase [Candidatus Aminicenantes bacterium]NIN20261.1 alpha/beta fold hydrolase [Candidatus Aminicenantes bacterium]NIN44040.1 alpha/beta fold hydrolase [Candidatus Aminicenantes bacterium]NIN86850.1 alpha/beta fold hydrolase [Candidatus Aminicenantes bacterium]